MVRIRAARPTQDHRVNLTFTDGSEKEVDLAPYLQGPVFEKIRSDLQMFRSLRVDGRMGAIVWPNGADIDPDVLYFGLKPVWMKGESDVAR